VGSMSGSRLREPSVGTIQSDFKQSIIGVKDIFQIESDDSKICCLYTHGIGCWVYVIASFIHGSNWLNLVILVLLVLSQMVDIYYHVSPSSRRAL